MDRDDQTGKLTIGFYRGLAGTIAFATCLSALPVWAGQNQQAQDQQNDQPAATVQQADPSAPTDAPDGPPPAYQPVPPKLTVPGGTVITVRTSQFLSSDQNQVGDLVNAELQQPLVVDGWVVARRGQTVLGRVAVAQKAGRIKGVSQLGVELSDLVLVDGQQLRIRTQLMQTSAGPSKERDAQAIGTTTGMGAIIGAAAGEGRGAAVGAGAGAVAGIAGVLLTRGRATIIPPETVLTFQLDAPIAFSTQRSTVAFRPVTQADYDNGRLGHRPPQHFAVAPPPPYYGGYYGGYYPWGYYPAPFYFGFGYSRFGGFERGRFRR